MSTSNPAPHPTLLLVDDDDDIRESMRLLLELEGFAVVEASNGKEALEVLARPLRPNVMLVDLMMPVMNGWELLAALDADESLATIPVIVVTAFSKEAGGVKGKLVLQKPVDTEALFEIVRAQCTL